MNEITVGNFYHSPLTIDIIDDVAKTEYITAIDSKSGFYQIPIDEDLKHLTSFVAPNGLYAYKRMEMGLKNAPCTIRKLMDLVLGRLSEMELHTYLDEVIVIAETLEEHGIRFRRLMKRLDDANLTTEPSKCQFLQREASSLGHLVGDWGICPDPRKRKAVRNYPVSNSSKKVEQLLGQDSPHTTADS